MINFQKVFEDGIYSIKPIDSEITIVVEKKTCNGYEVILELTTEQETEIISQQGFYRVTIQQEGEDDIVFSVNSFLDVLESASETVKDIFCNSCSDTPCDEIDYSECTKINDALHKLITFVQYMNSSVQPYLSHVFEVSKCEEVEDVLCTIDTESIQGKYVQSLESIKKLIAKYYIAIRLFYSDNIENLGFNITIDYIDQIMQFNKIICCIEKETNYKYTKFKTNMANFNINVSYTNRPPSIVGNYTLEVDGNSQPEVVLNSAFFTTDTTPAYNDPEGDAPYELKILSLPAEGTLKYNGSAVQVNDIIPFSDINNDLLTYDATGLTYDTTTVFTFAVSDTGSQNFSS